jgi:cytochrome c-type biogenesis protein CcmH/NrfG
MMLDRDKISFWTRIAAIALSAIFIGSFIFYGIGSNVNYNLLDLLGSSPEQEQQQEATTDVGEQIATAEQDLEEDPGNPRLVRRLAGLYLQDGQSDQALEVLEQGREAAPDDPVIALYLGQAYEQNAQGIEDEEERQTAYEQAGSSYAAAADLQEDNPQSYLAAGQAYEQAGEKGRAIQYYNGYLEVEPDGEQASAVEERIQNLLSGGETTGGAGVAKKEE